MRQGLERFWESAGRETIVKAAKRLPFLLSDATAVSFALWPREQIEGQIALVPRQLRFLWIEDAL